MLLLLPMSSLDIKSKRDDANLSSWHLKQAVLDAKLLTPHCGQTQSPARVFESSPLDLAKPPSLLSRTILHAVGGLACSGITRVERNTDKNAFIKPESLVFSHRAVD